MYLFSFGCHIFFLISSCTKETPYPDSDNYDLSDDAVVLSYNEFLNDDDVILLDSDTTSISISSAFLGKINKKIKPGSVICVWQAINAIPFVRNVEKVEKKGSDVILTTSRGDIGDIFENADFTLNTDLYINSQEDDLGVRYKEGSTYHPAVIIWGDENSSDDDNYSTAEDLMAEDAEFTFIDKTFTTNLTLGNDHVKFGIVDGTTRVYMSVETNISIRLFKSMLFECYFKGGINTHFPVTLEGDLKATFEKEGEITSFTPYTSVFWVGPIPVGITVEPSVVLDLEAEIGASFALAMPIDFNTDIRLGPKYDGNWSFVHDFNQTFNMGIDDVSFTAALSAEASVALYFKAGVYLYSAAGPYLKIGPKLDAKVEGKAVTESGKPDKLVFETTGEFDMGGKVGAELKIAKWSLAKWETEFSLYNAKIWEYTKEVEKK